MARWQAARLHHGRKVGPRASRRSYELPDLNRLLHTLHVALNPISSLYAAIVGTVANSGGWVRASDLHGFSVTLLPTELHRSQALLAFNARSHPVWKSRAG